MWLGSNLKSTHYLDDIYIQIYNNVEKCTLLFVQNHTNITQSISVSVGGKMELFEDN